jgi:hypothetical protein
VPDNDIFTHFVSKVWRKPTRCFHGEAEADEIAPMLLSSAARCLKHTGGFPELPQMVELYNDFLVGRIEEAELYERARSIAALGRHSRHVRLGERVLRRLVVQQLREPASLNNPSAYYATQFILELISHNFLDPSIPEIENLARFASIEERLGKAAECHNALLTDGRIPRIAEILLSDPGAATMRLPPSKRARVDVRDMLSLVVR